MFEFFKYLKDELNGLDMENVEEQNKKKQKYENKNKDLFSKNLKRMIYAIGILYLVGATLIIHNILLAGFEPKIIKYTFLFALDLFILIALNSQKKKMQITVWCCIIVFILSNLFVSI